MRIHEKGQLFDGIRYRDTRINLEQNQEIGQINWKNNIIGNNQIYMNKNNQIKIDVKKKEDGSMQNMKLNRSNNAHYEDITMKEEIKLNKK